MGTFFVPPGVVPNQITLLLISSPVEIIEKAPNVLFLKVGVSLVIGNPHLHPLGGIRLMASHPESANKPIKLALDYRYHETPD